MLNPTELRLQRIFERARANRGGSVATYIPELGKVNPELFAVCLATVDGHVYRLGTAAAPFTIQSISKPFVYGLAIEARGLDSVARRIGFEPSGEAFNSISLEAGTGRPRNPMINAGAIAAAGLAPGETPADRLKHVLALLGGCAGRELRLDEAVFRSETESGHRNRAIAHLLRNAGMLHEPVEERLQLYFQQCSVEITCEDLAWMGATLANGGVHPVTGQRVMRGKTVDLVVNVMSTCGMYDYAGEWMARVGMPAKSGVGGGVVCVLPGHFGLGVYSPRLDERGNSARGIEVCEAVSREFELHLLRTPGAGPCVLRAGGDLSSFRSKRGRSREADAVLEEQAGRVAVFSLQGAVGFAGAESVLRSIPSLAGAVRFLALDLDRVTILDPAAARLLGTLAEVWPGEMSLSLFPNRCQPHEALAEHADPIWAARPPRIFPSSEHLFEWCEDRLLAEQGFKGTPNGELPWKQHPLVAGLPVADADALRGIAERVTYPAGAHIIRHGANGSGVFLLTAGEASVLLPTGAGARRLATLGPGGVCGELALADPGPRSADVVADASVVCWTFDAKRLEQLDDRAPGLRARLLASVCQDLVRRLRNANAEIAALGG